MKNQTTTNLIIRSSIALALALSIGPLVQAQSVEPTKAKNMTETTMMERCQEMLKQKQQLENDIKAQDNQLTEQLKEMNRAPEDKKVDLMAAVLTHMVEQRITMDARKAKMEEEMMQHMMEHIMMGKESLSQCPMMKSMKNADEKSADAHKEHQEERK